MKFQYWIGIFIFFFLIQCTHKEGITEYPYEPLDTIVFNEVLITLGEHLFFDKRLSVDNTISCATCHQPELAFTDGKRVSKGIHQRMGKRNTPSLWNVKNQQNMMWDAGVISLE